ncbi:hypothetical protein WA158_005653 [Blastocystis sp. Blastoise]
MNSSIMPQESDEPWRNDGENGETMSYPISTDTYKEIFALDDKLDMSDAIELLMTRKNIHLQSIYDEFAQSLSADRTTLLYYSKTYNETYTIIPFYYQVFYSLKNVKSTNKNIKQEEIERKEFIISKLSEYSLFQEDPLEYQLSPMNDNNEEENVVVRFDRITGNLYYENLITNEKRHLSNESLRTTSNIKDIWKTPYNNMNIFDFLKGESKQTMESIEPNLYNTVYSLCQWIDNYHIPFPPIIQLYAKTWPLYISNSCPSLSSYMYSVSVFVSPTASTAVTFEVDLSLPVHVFMITLNKQMERMRLFPIDIEHAILKIAGHNDYLVDPIIPVINYSSIQRSVLNNTSISLYALVIAENQYAALQDYILFIHRSLPTTIIANNIIAPAVNFYVTQPLPIPRGDGTSDFTIDPLFFLIGNDFRVETNPIDNDKYIHQPLLPAEIVVSFELEIKTNIQEILQVSCSLYEGIFPMYFAPDIKKPSSYILLNNSFRYDPKTSTRHKCSVQLPISISILPPSTKLLITFKGNNVKNLYSYVIPLFSPSSTYQSGVLSSYARPFPVLTKEESILFAPPLDSPVDINHQYIQLSVTFPSYVNPILAFKPNFPPKSSLLLPTKDQLDLDLKRIVNILNREPLTAYTIEERRYLYKYKEMIIYLYIPELFHLEDAETPAEIHVTKLLNEMPKRPLQGYRITIDQILYSLYASVNFTNIDEIYQYINILYHVFHYIFPLSSSSSPLYYVSFLSPDPLIYSLLPNINPPLSISTTTQYTSVSVSPPFCQISWLISFLGPRFGYPLIRALAIEYINMIDDIIISKFLTIFVQCLYVENTVDNIVLRFLIYRMLRSPHFIGHYLYWIIRSEITRPALFPSLFILLTIYILYGGPYVHQICKQVVVHNTVAEMCLKVQKEEGAKRNALVKELIQSINSKLPSSFILPLSPRYLSKGVIPQDTKIMSSKKAPIFISFINAYSHGNPIDLLYKEGDDLRQDWAILAMFSHCAQVLRYYGYQLYTSIYRVLYTDRLKGYVQIVQNSKTLKDIFETQNIYTGAMSYDSIYNYIKSFNQDETSLKIACRRFMNSLTIYIVLTYIYGIADRHPSNIMIKQSGELFHIDFGHILGNFKTFAGVKRETQQVVFNPQMLRIFGGEKTNTYKEFMEICVSMFNTLRKNWFHIMSSMEPLILMNVPELTKTDDLMYLYDQLIVDSDDNSAGDILRKKIMSSAHSVVKRVDDSIHVLAHLNNKENKEKEGFDEDEDEDEDNNYIENTIEITSRDASMNQMNDISTKGIENNPNKFNISPIQTNIISSNMK